jgi:DnaK suppressor protein
MTLYVLAAIGPGDWGVVMEDIEVGQFRRALEELLAGLDEPLARRHEIAVENTPDALDQVQNAADRALAIRQLELDSSRLRGLREALGRVMDGTYGMCLRCDCEISMKRLKAVPWTPYCLQCQEAVDHEEMMEAARDEYATSYSGR